MDTRQSTVDSTGLLGHVLCVKVPLRMSSNLQCSRQGLLSGSVATSMDHGSAVQAYRVDRLSRFRVDMAIVGVGGAHRYRPLRLHLTLYDEKGVSRCTGARRDVLGSFRSSTRSTRRGPPPTVGGESEPVPPGVGNPGTR